MTDIIHFADVHFGGNREQMQSKLNEFKPDLITIETAATYPLTTGKKRYQESYRVIKENILGTFITDAENNIFYRTSDPTQQALLEYAFNKFPIFFIDAYRRIELEKEWPLPYKEATKVVGILPSNSRVAIHNFRLHPNLPIKDKKPFVASSNLAMAHHIDALVKKYAPRRIAHLSGRAHYTGEYENKLQDLCNTLTYMVWDIFEDEPIDLEKQTKPMLKGPRNLL